MQFQTTKLRNQPRKSSSNFKLQTISPSPQLVSTHPNNQQFLFCIIANLWLNSRRYQPNKQKFEVTILQGSFSLFDPPSVPVISLLCRALPDFYSQCLVIMFWIWSFLRPEPTPGTFFMTCDYRCLLYCRPSHLSLFLYLLYYI